MGNTSHNLLCRLVLALSGAAACSTSATGVGDRVDDLSFRHWMFSDLPRN